MGININSRLAYKIRNREDAAFYITLLVSVSIILSAFLVVGVKIAGHKEIGQDLIYPGIALLQILAMVMLRARHGSVGTHLFLISVFLLVLYMDYRIPYNYGPTILIYVLPVAFCIFLLEKTFRIILFASLFLGAFVFRTLYFSGMGFLENSINFLLVILSVFTMVVVKNLLVTLNEYKLESIRKLHNSTLSILANVTEVKDKETNYHLQRVEMIVGKLVVHLQENRVYSRYITSRYVEDIRSAAFLHDIGKIGIPDAILFKPAKLDPGEYEIIKTHSVIGYELIEDAIKDLEEESIYDLALEIVRHHHERWDGRGYPDGLAGTAIPLSARIMSVVDVYDALISRRPYKEPFSHNEAVRIIREGRGTQFDPDIVDAFLEYSGEIHDLVKEYLD